MNALQDIRAVDFYKALAGSLFAQCLGDFDADAIKVVPVEHGDKNRRWPPFRDGEGAIYLEYNSKTEIPEHPTQRSTHPWRIRSTSAQT